MRLRIVVFTLVGALIAAAIAAPLVNSECEVCGGDGELGCPLCWETGATFHVFSVECACGGDPGCPICHGLGWYQDITTKPCELCDGKGEIPCSACRGDGKRNLIERIPGFWRGD